MYIRVLHFSSSTCNLSNEFCSWFVLKRDCTDYTEAVQLRQNVCQLGPPAEAVCVPVACVPCTITFNLELGIAVWAFEG